MKYEFLIKTNCAACLGIIPAFLRKIEGVKFAEIEEVDSGTGKIRVEYEGKLNREALAQIICKETGYQVV